MIGVVALMLWATNGSSRHTPGTVFEALVLM